MRKIILLAVSLVLVSCGSDRGSVNSELTASQREGFKQTLTSVGRIEKSALAAQKAKRGFAEALPSEDNREQMSKLMADKQCAIKLDMKDGDKPTRDQFGSFQLSVAGDTCPVSLDFHMKANGDFTGPASSLDLNFGFLYEVRDEEFKKLNDISSMDIKGDGSFRNTEDSSKGNFSMEGSLVSQAHGSLKFYSKGTVDGRLEDGKAVVTDERYLGIEYPEYTAELRVSSKQTSDGLKEKKFYLNGIEIDENQFVEFKKSAGALTSLLAN